MIVLGNIFFGIIFSVLNGKKSLGIVNFTFPPSSLISKKASRESTPSFDAPIDAIPEISSVSAPLKILRILKLGLTEKPTL
jgi:hypothetical protein